MNFKQWLKEMAGTDAITNDCRPHADYQVFGACSDKKKRKKKNEGLDTESKERDPKKAHGHSSGK